MNMSGRDWNPFMKTEFLMRSIMIFYSILWVEQVRAFFISKVRNIWAIVPEKIFKNENMLLYSTVMEVPGSWGGYLSFSFDSNMTGEGDYLIKSLCKRLRWEKEGE